MAAHRRHDISDKVWANIEKLLPGSKGSVGRPSADNRLFRECPAYTLLYQFSPKDTGQSKVK